jgi:hypothetical protein
MIERRLSHGEAIETGGGIVASDKKDDALVRACETTMESLRGIVVPDARVRLVADATLDGVTSTATVTLGEHSVVTDPRFAADDVAFLRSLIARQAPASDLPENAPIVWRNGTAAVLLHEAVGHAREHEHADAPMPRWLAVDSPLRLRRASFRDIPLRRMTTLTVRQHDAPFALDPCRIEVLLVDGGSYDPLTELVTVRVAVADFVDGTRSSPLPPFEIVRTRGEVLSSICGATGEPVRYPGVICSREGQELAVGSFAPVLVTR